MSEIISAPFVFRDIRATVGQRNLHILHLLDGVYVSPYRHAIEAEKDTEMTSQCGAPEPEIQQVRHQNIATDLNPPPLGVSLCAAEGLGFSEVFSQQFRLSALPEDVLPGFELHRWGRWVLQAGPDLPVASSEFDNGSGAIFFLGIGVDPNGTIISSESLATQLDGVREPAAVAAYLSEAAGRYVFVILKDETQRIYLDPLGSLGVLFDPLTGAVGSTLNILLSRDVERNTIYPFADLAVDELGRFAFGHTEDLHAKRVVPNHFLDLDTLQQQRHWPAPDDIQEPTDAAEEANTLGRINDRLGQIIESLSRHASQTILPLSGGLDSRILLACGRDSLGELKLYSHAENMMSRKDVRIATKLAGRVGSSLVAIDPARDAQYQIADYEAKEKLQAAYWLATAGLSMPPLRHEIL